MNYDSSDGAISINKILNVALLNIILQEGHNIDRIFFTSDVAKQWFSLALGIPYNHSRISLETINGKEYSMRTLMTPAGNARTAFYYFGNFPPTIQEIENRNLGRPYALGYRKRYYHDFLNRIV